MAGKWTKIQLRTSSMLDFNRFRFLNHESTIIDKNDWNNPIQTKLWLYNLHYFDDLNSTSADNKKLWHSNLIEKWVKDNSPVIGVGWEPYTISLRVTNWIKWALNGNELKPSWEKSIHVQTAHLLKNIEYDLLGNHLIANAKALIFAGAFFESKTNKILSKGLKILSNEIEEQILDDGGHFERSPMYHAIILEDILDLINLSRTYTQIFPKSITDEWKEVTISMLKWLEQMTHPDGKISFFNDAAFNVGAKLVEIKEYAEFLGIIIETHKVLSLVFNKYSGYVRVEKNDCVAIIDIAPVGPIYQAGHAHADTLSFELSIGSNRVLVNSGTSIYENTSLRRFQRSTKSHNTVEINNSNSSEVWHRFRTARRTTPHDIKIQRKGKTISISASHSGYKLINKNIHKRSWQFSDNKVIVSDTVIGKYNKAVSRFYFHPDCNFEFPNDKSISIEIGHRNLIMDFDTVSFSLINSNWYPEFGHSIQNKCVEILFTNQSHKTTFIWKSVI